LEGGECRMIFANIGSKFHALIKLNALIREKQQISFDFGSVMGYWLKYINVTDVTT
jgi:hypothetical protein